MEGIREFAAMVCVAAVGCCALKLLLPESGLEPVLRVILSAFFLLCLALPLRRAGLGAFPTPEAAASFSEAAQPETDRLARAYQRQLEEAVAENLERVIGARLEKMGAGGTKLFVNVNTAQDGRIDIRGVEVALPQEAEHLRQQIEAYIAGELELPCKIMVEVQEDGNQGRTSSP